MSKNKYVKPKVELIKFNNSDKTNTPYLDNYSSALVNYTQTKMSNSSSKTGINLHY